MANFGKQSKQKVSSKQVPNLGNKKSIFSPRKFPHSTQNATAISAPKSSSGYHQPKPGELIANVTGSSSTARSSLPPNYIADNQLTAPKRQDREVNSAPVNQLKAPPRHSNSSETTREPIQKQQDSIPNQTGLPDNLKAGVESLSGYSLDNVRVHYNSPKPAQLQALAYTQGTDIHVATGQEKHLPHEAWHVVQQMQGRVKPTMQMKGVQINDNAGLEKEADGMGEKALQIKPLSSSKLHDNSPTMPRKFQQPPDQRAIQRVLSYSKPKDKGQLDKDLGSTKAQSIKRFDHAETLTNTWGDESNTANFSHGNNSEYLNNVDIKWNGYKIGQLRPLGKIKGGRFDPNVKMHLVNSFLNPNANNWDENWVFGHADLNHDHERIIEKPAKDYHPGNPNAANKKLSTGENIYALSYRTEVSSKSEPNTIETKDNLVNNILAALTTKTPDAYESPSKDEVENNVKIHGSKISDYFNTWKTAIGNTVAKKITSFARIYGVNKKNNIIVSQDIPLTPVIDSDFIESKVLIDGKVDGIWLASKSIIKEKSTGRTPRKRKAARDGDPSGKKSKSK